MTTNRIAIAPKANKYYVHIEYIKLLSRAVWGLNEHFFELVKHEGLKFVEQELENITIPDVNGSEGRFSYSINNVRVTNLQLSQSELWFQPNRQLVLDINNASISLNFQRKLLYWLFYDVGMINASAEGVHIKTDLDLARDSKGRLKISNMTCNASINRMQAGFSGTLKRVYDFLASFITTGMRFLLNQQICPALRHAGMVLLNSMLNTVPVKNPVDDYIGIDYSLLSDPDVSEDSLDMDFRIVENVCTGPVFLTDRRGYVHLLCMRLRSGFPLQKCIHNTNQGMFYSLNAENDTIPNTSPALHIKQKERMVYIALSEYFFDSAMYAYYRSNILSLEIANEQMPKDLEVLLRTSYFGSLMLLQTLLQRRYEWRLQHHVGGDSAYCSAVSCTAHGLHTGQRLCVVPLLHGPIDFNGSV
ncbi:unnamed protein product [Ranitomeya imitator]|uniref:Lipid-binding serum glycoprotein N-terminal domain-containing protein n=1 Tax=Ranitomeya imitator TaxID=111125 RepID=A0ABN9MSA1_9NEOB|nr:unnamed protein product [Ranitomeya imitator]